MLRHRLKSLRLSCTYHLPDEFFNNLNRSIERLNGLFPKSVMICGGSSQTWGEKDTVYDIHAARIRERMGQGGRRNSCCQPY